MRTLIISLIVLLLLPAASLQAQVNVQNNGTAYISTAGDIFYINGSLTNANTAALTNNGALYVRQNLTNNQAAMATGSGTLYLNGTIGQVVNGSQQFKTFNLVTNNSAGITLNNDLSVSGAHTYTAGIIATSATPNYLVYEAGSSYSGDADSRHVHGWVKKFGATAFTFPVGNATIERTIGISGLSVTSEFNAKYYQGTPNTTQLLSPIVSLDPSEYWALNKVSGGSASVPMNWDNSKVALPNWVLADIVVANYNGSLWTSQGGSATGNVTTTGNITSNSIASFNLFTFASRSYVIPLTLISFSAIRVEDYIQLDWHTANEYNVDHFSIERSYDGIHFYSIGQLPARNQGGDEHYSFNDNATIAPVVYYRLRSIDVDGKEKLSSIVTVRDNSTGSQLSLVTNPVHDLVVLHAGSLLTGLFDYRIATVNGQLLQQGKIDIRNGGQYQFQLAQNVKQGAYVLTVSNTGLQKIFSFKMIVSR